MESYEKRKPIDSKEAIIHKHIEELAEREEMAPEDIISDMVTFLELSETDEDAMSYFEVMADKTGLPTKELIKYAENQRNPKEDSSV